MRKISSIFFLLFILSSGIKIGWASENVFSFASNKDAQRFQQLTKEIRCIVCQNQSLAESSAPLANDLRYKIYRMIVTQQSTSDIENYLVKRYGEFILLRPRLQANTWILWYFPFAAILASFCGLGWLYARMKR